MIMWFDKKLQNKNELSDSLLIVFPHINPLDVHLETTNVSKRSSVRSLMSVFGSYVPSSPSQMLMHGETCTRRVTLCLKSSTLPLTWTTRWPETSLWSIYIWRASMRSKRATGHLKTMDTLVNVIWLENISILYYYFDMRLDIVLYVIL